MMKKQLRILPFQVLFAVMFMSAVFAVAQEKALETNNSPVDVAKTNQTNVSDSPVAGRNMDAASADVVNRTDVAGRSDIAGRGELAGEAEEAERPVSEVEAPKAEVPTVSVSAPSDSTGAEPEEGPVFELLPAGEHDVQPVEAGVSANLISISLDKVPIPDVVDMFSRISGANIIIAGTFTNVVTATLKNVEWKSALSLVLGSVNLALIEDPSGILMVVTSEMYNKKIKQIEETKPLVTKIFSPMYLNVVDLVEQIKKLNILSPRGMIITSQSKEQDSANLKSSSLATVVVQNPGITTEIIVTDIKKYVDRVEKLINDLDRREPQVFIEARIIDVISGDSTKLGFDWEMLDKFGVSAGLRDLKWTFSDDHSVENTADKRDYQYDKRSLQDNLDKRYDVVGKQYEETTTTYEESPPGSGNWIANTVVTPTRKINDTIDQGRDITSTYADKVKDTILETKMASAIMDVSDASLYLSALKRAKNVDVISHPLIIVGNNVEAKIHVGERYPTVFSTKDVESVGATSRDSYSETVEWNDLGMTLWVIPEIDAEANMVRMTINPQMSTWIKDITTPQGSVFPVISTRHLSSRVSVPSGHTVVIGGLIENSKKNEVKRIPILSDIPIIGRFFQHTADVNQKSNLIILLTPTILNEDAPLTGFEAIAHQSIERLEKIPLAPVKGSVAPNALPATTDEQLPSSTVDVSVTEPPSRESGEPASTNLPAESSHSDSNHP